MLRAELRETSSPEETNWYFAIEVWSCPWTIENMHNASAKLKFNKLVRNVGVVKVSCLTPELSKQITLSFSFDIII